MITQSDSPVTEVYESLPPKKFGGTTKSRTNGGLTSGTAVALALDYLSVTLGIIAGFVVYHLFKHEHVNNETFKLFLFSLQYTLAFVLFARIHSLYNRSASLLHIHETASVLRVSVFTLVVLCFGILFSQAIVPRLLVLLSWVFISLFVVIQKHLTRGYIATLRRPPTKQGRALIIGSGADARRVFSYLSHSPDLHMRPVGFFEEEGHGERVIYSHDYTFKESAPVYSGPLSEDFLTRMDVSDIFVANPSLSSANLAEIASLANNRRIQLSIVGSFHPHLARDLASVRNMDGILVTSFAVDEGNRVAAYESIKRICDFCITLTVLLLILPAMFCVAMWVKFSSDGPIFFRQERIGLHGKPFSLYKFRSMYTSAPKYGRSPEDGNDPRITRAGRFLRKTSLDELPQLFNVLRGDMALVGPRPEMPYVVNQYSAHEAQRLSVIPGITGLWQLSADRKFPIHESIEYDLYYLENRGFFLDLAILVHTAAFAMKGI